MLSAVYSFGQEDSCFQLLCSSHLRLITGGRDGCLKIWNFNNGQCLKILKRGKVLKLLIVEIPKTSTHSSDQNLKRAFFFTHSFSKRRSRQVT